MKVLVIDDDKFIRTLLASELSQENIVVELANDGDEGIKKAKEMAPDVVVLDLILPKKDGFEVLAELKEIHKGSRPAIVIFTTLAQEHDKKEAFALGARSYFLKGEHTVHHIVEEVKKEGAAGDHNE